MFNRVFGKPKDGKANTLTTLGQLNETLEMLEKREQVVHRKIASEMQRAMEFSKLKNKKAAINCLKRKKLFEAQAEQLANYQLRLHDQMILLEGAKATTDTVEALRSGASAMKAMQKATNIEDVDRTMEDITESTENMKQIQEALATPVGLAAEFDDDELEAELEELEDADLDEQLLAPTPTPAPAPVSTPISTPAFNPVVPAPIQQQTVTVTSKKVPVHSHTEDDELAALQSEMAL